MASVMRPLYPIFDCAFSTSFCFAELSLEFASTAASPILIDRYGVGVVRDSDSSKFILINNTGSIRR